MVKTNKAIVASVDLGFQVINGLQLPNGSYAVAVPQAANLFQIPNKHASRDFKALLGEGFSFPKVKSDLNSKAVNIVSTQDLTKIAYYLSKKGNKVAEAFVLAAIEETIERRFDKAFNIKRTEEEREAKFAARVDGKLGRRTLTDAIKDYLDRHDELSNNYRNFVYSNVSDRVNNALFGKPSRIIKNKLGLKKKEGIRDRLSPKSLNLLDTLERYAALAVDNKDQCPIKAIEDSINNLGLKADWSRLSN